MKFHSSLGFLYPWLPCTMWHLPIDIFSEGGPRRKRLDGAASISSSLGIGTIRCFLPATAIDVMLLVMCA